MATTTVFAGTNDDFLEAANATYATALSTASYTNGGAGIQIGQNFSTPTYYLDVAYFDFDTSSVPDGDTVSAAVLSLYLTVDHSTTDFVLDVAAFDWSASGLTTGDWRNQTQLAAHTVLATLDTNGIGSVNAYKDFTEVASGLAGAINKTGHTYLIVYSARQAAGTTPSGEEFMTFSSADAANQPKLVITHSGGGGGDFLDPMGSMGFFGA